MKPLHLLALFASFAAPAFPAEPKTLIARPVEDTLAVLHNPGMGWVLYENGPLDADPHGSSTMLTLPDEDFPGVDAVALMFSWEDVERRDGEFDFSAADRAYDHWKSRGKEIQLRLSTESLLWWANRQPPAGRGVPRHVLDRIPASRKQTRESSGIAYDLVDARDPLYRERLSRFLREVARHFTGPRAVTLVDLRGFGLWGEWHTGYRYPSPDDRHEALAGIIDAYSDAFPHTSLALSYSYDPDGPPELYAGPTFRFDPAATRTYRDFLHFSAFDHALTKPNVTFRRDGAGGAVHSNERRLCDEAFRTPGRGPMVCEFLGGYAAAKQAGDAHVEHAVNDALSLHPNYVNLLGWHGGDARDFLRGRPDLIAHGLRTMGYRLVPGEARYPAAIAGGSPLRLETTWVNRAVGRPARELTLRIRLAQGRKISTDVDDGSLAARGWVRDETYRRTHEVALPDLPAGDYDLQIAVIDGATGRRIALPLTEPAEPGVYRIGGIRVAGSGGR